MASRTTKTVTVTAALVAAAAVGAGGGAATYAALGSEDGDTVVRQVTVESAEPAASTSESLSVSEIYEQAYEGVVEITSISSQASPVGRARSARRARAPASSSTARATSSRTTTSSRAPKRVTVRFSDGSTYDATVVGTDPFDGSGGGQGRRALLGAEARSSSATRRRSASARASSRSAARSGSKTRRPAASSAPSTGR